MIIAIYLAAYAGRNLALMFVFLIIFVPIMLVFGDSIFLLDFTYFTDRLNLKETRIISSLVYLQGWSRALISLQQTAGHGIGFQNLENAPFGYFGNLLQDILGENKNFNDGGFVAAKLIGEFGILGVVAVYLYLVLFFKAVFEVIDYLKKAKHKAHEDDLRFIANILIVFFSVELLIRGTGYFSLGIILFWTGYSLRLLSFSRVNVLR